MLCHLNVQIISIFRFKPQLADGHTSAFLGRSNRIEWNSTLFYCYRCANNSVGMSVITITGYFVFEWYFGLPITFVNMYVECSVFSVQCPQLTTIAFKHFVQILFANNVFRNGTRHSNWRYNLLMAYTQLLLENNTVLDEIQKKEWERDQELKFVFYSDWLSWIHFRWGQRKTIHGVYVILQRQTLEKCGLSSEYRETRKPGKICNATGQPNWKFSSAEKSKFKIVVHNVNKTDIIWCFRKPNDTGIQRCIY